MMIKLNPYAKTLRRKELLRSHPGVKAKVALHDARKKARRDAVKEARAKKNFTPKPNTRPPGAKLTVLDYLKKKGLKPNKRLLQRQKEKHDRKKEKKTSAAEEPKTGEAASKAEAKVAFHRKIGRKPLPGILKTKSRRLDPKGLKAFRQVRTRMLERADRLRYKTIVPGAKPGKTPFVEFHKKHKKAAEIVSRRDKKEAAKKKVEATDKAPTKAPKKSDAQKEPKRNTHVKAFSKLMHS